MSFVVVVHNVTITLTSRHDSAVVFQSVVVGLATIGPAQMLQSIVHTPTWMNILIIISVCTIYTSVVRVAHQFCCQSFLGKFLKLNIFKL